jgi:hypothetical protein
MFTFFGLLADPCPGLADRIAAVWRELDVVSIDDPISAIGARFGQDRYEPADEDIPREVIRQVEELSAEYPATRFLLLRTECLGGAGECFNQGLVVRDRRHLLQAQGQGALRTLIKEWGVDIGPREIFTLLRRDYPWDRAKPSQ